MRTASIVDGNALAGALADVFTGDATMMRGVCGGCGSAAPLGEAVVELDAACAIVRCRSCTVTLCTLLFVDGVTRLRIGSLRELDVA